MSKEIHIEYKNDGWTADLHPPLNPLETTTLIVDWQDKAILIKETPLKNPDVVNLVHSRC